MVLIIFHKISVPLFRQWLVKIYNFLHLLLVPKNYLEFLKTPKANGLVSRFENFNLPIMLKIRENTDFQISYQSHILKYYNQHLQPQKQFTKIWNKFWMYKTSKLLHLCPSTEQTATPQRLGSNFANCGI